ncbi:MAG: helix-turn-helix domain-containing protein [Brachybacterium sp.]|uniref:helix-turn-helix domain-containing protein n=1 Tax=unclassified Brachybacterium TaxID=2623841 RepID=UPI003F96AD23
MTTLEPLLRELIGGALRRRRRERGRTLTDVAGQAGVSMQHLSDVERGRKDASSEILAAICGALGVTAAQLMSEAAQPSARSSAQSAARSSAQSSALPAATPAARSSAQPYARPVLLDLARAPRSAPPELEIEIEPGLELGARSVVNGRHRPSLRPLRPRDVMLSAA